MEESGNSVATGKGTELHMTWSQLSHFPHLLFYWLLWGNYLLLRFYHKFCIVKTFLSMTLYCDYSIEKNSSGIPI